jgi:serine/threonine protein kinase
VWDERLLRLIEEADVFQLFWSRHALDSPYVRREYEHALALNRPNFVRPTYWEEPLPSDPARKLPPEALLRLHFQRIGPFLLSGVLSRVVGPSPPQAIQPHEGAPGDVGPSEIPGYEIQGHLRRGAMAAVHLARDRDSGLLVVIQLRPSADTQHGVVGPEMPLRHPNIVPVLAAGEAGGRRYTVKPYMEGGSLADRLLRGGPLPGLEAARLVRSLADAAHYAHTWGVWHLNLKPSKVLFDGAGNPALTDFHQIRHRQGAIFGTPAYLAPEQAAGEAARLGRATDVYGLGAILYECLTGRPPFRGGTPADTLYQALHDEPVRPCRLQPKVPRDLEAICLKCLEKDPRRRYARAADLADDLGRFLEAKPIRAGRIPAIKLLFLRFRYLVIRHPRLTAVLPYLLLALAACLLAWLLFR